MILENYLFTHDQQFGFKSKHSTEFCIYTVKSVSKYYTQHHSPVYACFLDVSKAFDKINHIKLYRKLLDRKTPIVIVYFLFMLIIFLINKSRAKLDVLLILYV